MNITDEENVNIKESILLFENGIHYIYDSHYGKHNEYKEIDYTFYRRINNKAVFLIAKGTNIAYIIPYYIIINYNWFNNALGECEFASNAVELPTGNIILSVESPYPYRLKFLYEKILNGSIREYQTDHDRMKTKEVFDYFGID
jgi:hypothetical protein